MGNKEALVVGSQILMVPLHIRIWRALQPYGVGLALVVLVAVAGILQPVFLELPNIINVLRQVSITGVLAVGMTFVIINGGIDLSVGSVVGLTGMLAVIFQHHGLLVGIGVALAVGTLVGVANGIGVAKGIVPFIMTLATMTGARGFAFMVSDGFPVMGVSEAYAWIGAGHVLGIPVPVLILGVAVLGGHLVLAKTTFGRTVYAVGGNEEAARLAGINLTRNRIIVYSIAGFLAGVTGVVITARMTSCDPSVGSMFELDAIAATVIGGTSMLGGEGKMSRTLIGALIMGILANVMNLMNISPYPQQVVKGVIILGAVLMDRTKVR